MKKILISIFALALVFGLSITSMAASSETYNYNGYIMEKIELPKDDYPYAVLARINSSEVRLYLSKEPLTLKLSYPMAGGSLKTDYTVPVGTQLKQYTLLNDSQELGEGSVFNQNGGVLGLTLIWSSHDIYDLNGDLFFEGDPNFLPPLPLAEAVLKVTEGAMETTLPQMGGMMKILAACGVGCLALLVGLKLFGKRSLLFLRK